MDDYELQDRVQHKVQQYFNCISEENLDELADLSLYRKEFMRLFGFEHAHIDYEKDVDTEL